MPPDESESASTGHELPAPDHGDATRASQPGGVVTFLFTDIQGSTKLWESYPADMAVALARHDAIMREAIGAHHGHVFKTVGDAFCAAFPSASDGLRAAVAAQRALHAESWPTPIPIRVRMGLHTGEPEQRDNDYFGQPLNRVARLLAVGHGGQTLLSGETEQRLSTDDLPGGLTLRDMGELRLKDLARRERVYQAVVPGLPAVFPKLKTPPAPARGVAASFGSTLLGFVVYRVSTAPPEQRGLSLFSPSSLIGGFKGLVLEISAIQEMFLLAIFAALLALAVAAAWVWRRTSEFRPGRQASGVVQLTGQFVTFRVVTFLAALCLIVLGSYAYQQYLWRVSLPIPDNAIGFALTQDAAAASFSDELADALFTQGQAQRIVVRELPVRFDARDTGKARRMGKRIGARAVVIYRTEELAGRTTYVSYVVFTNPSIGLAIAAPPETARGDEPGAEPGSALLVKEGVDVPVLRTETLAEMIDASAGIISYHEDRIREAITHLELARPDNPDAPNTGMVCFYLGNAYALDSQSAKANDAYDCAIGFFERQLASGQRLGPQDRLILVKSYLERGRQATFVGERETALTDFELALDHREELLGRASDLERPGDVHATYARLYGEMAQIYRFLDDDESMVFWERRAVEEADAITAGNGADEAHSHVQEGTARIFAGDCVGALAALNRALELDPGHVNARFNASFVHFSQGRVDLAEERLREIIAAQPDDVIARQQLANYALLRAVGSSSYLELAYFADAAALQREILQYDPTNLAAHRALAEFAAWVGDAELLDFTALSSGDDISLAKSQLLWIDDAERRQRALDAYGDAIQARRVIALELRPGDVDAQIALANAYFKRQQLLYNGLLAASLRGGDIDIPAAGEQLIADAEQIHRWTEPVVAEGSSATTLQRMQAWDLLLKSYDREWAWQRFFAESGDDAEPTGDEERAAEIAAEYRARADEAVAFIETNPPNTPDERDAAVQIYFAQVLIAFVIDQDAGAGNAVYEKIFALTQATYDERRENVRHVSTMCAETREEALGVERLDDGDAEGAARHYRQALEINPRYPGALLGLSAALLAAGDTAGSVEQARVGADVDPDAPEAWSRLVVAATAAGNGQEAGDALARFLAVVEERPAHERMGKLSSVLVELEELVIDRPETAGDIGPLLRQLATALDALEPVGEGTFQYPMLYARAGSLALAAGDVEQAVNLLERSLALDALQPGAAADMAIAALLSGGNGAEGIDAAVALLADPLWESASIERGDLLDLMHAEIERHLAQYPEDAGDLAPLLTALARA
ncbi:MAG TPA: tetratricopeptide repeat protein [Thermomicrobiales bacterium]|nr:tetratricopeptide repeat protein [Thermomicrobiales bacterium]